MEELYDKFKSNYDGSSDNIINFFTSHSIIFNNIHSFTNEKNLVVFCNIYYPYINALVEKNQYNNALNSTLKFIPVVENAIDELKIDRSTFVFYKWLLQLQATAHFYLKDYSSALILFRKLYAYEPENDTLKQWIEYCKIYSFGKLSSFLWIILLIGLAVDLFGKDFVPFYIRFSLLCIGVLAAFVSGIIDFYLKRKRNKLK